MMRVVVTRPQDDGERTAAALRARGHKVLVAPLLQIEPVQAVLRPNWGGVIITSANAVNAIAAHPAREALARLRLFAVGERSAEAARQIGFADVVAAGGSVRDLVRLLSARRADAEAPLLYLAGEDRASDLVAELAAHGIAAEMAVVYRAAAAPFPPALIAALKEGEVDAVLHFSRRSAESYLAGASRAGITAQALGVRHVCLSLPIAAPLTAAGAAKVAVAPRPDEAALIASLETSGES
jgi:uroporphyrinogen-III synthase